MREDHDSGYVADRLDDRTPNQLFGVHLDHPTDHRAIRMHSGAWMTDAEGAEHVSTLGVIADVGLARPILTAHGDPLVVPVTTTLSIDFDPLARLLSTHAVTVDAELVHVNARTAASRGVIRDASGQPVATATYTGHHQPTHAGWIEDTGNYDPCVPPATLSAIFGADPHSIDGRATLHLSVSPWLRNPRGSLHGGVLFALLGRVAAAALDGGAQSWALTSQTVDYERPAPLGASVSVVADVRTVGRTLAIVDVEGLLSDGRPFAVGRVRAVRRVSLR